MYLSFNIIIKGIVQGVFYRVSTQQKANQIGIVGWVRNNHDGSVEALFEAEEDQIVEMLEWCKIGPENASVESLSVLSKEQIEELSYDTFEIR